MTLYGNSIFKVLVVSLYIHQGCANERPNYSGYERKDLQSSNAHFVSDNKPVAHLKRWLLNNHHYQDHMMIHQGVQSGNSQLTTYDFCSNYHEYQTLIQLKDSETCLRSTDVWPLLESLSRHGGPEEGPKCMIHLIQQLGDAFGNIRKTPGYCHCQGYVNLSNFPDDDHGIFLKCWNDGISVNNYYQILYHEYYSERNNNERQCSHHHIWYPLSQIQHDYCQRNLVINLAHTFKQYVPGLQCNHVSSVLASTQQAESTTTTTAPHPTTDTITIHTPPPTPHIAIQTCDKYATINSLAYGKVFSHPSAGDCVQGDHSASEALVLELCHTNGAHNWIKGSAVMDNCAQIPLYTPVATFDHESFNSNGGQSGIFLGCLTNGFKLAAQECFTNFTVLHIEKGGIFARDPSIYHVVLF